PVPPKGSGHAAGRFSNEALRDQEPMESQLVGECLHAGPGFLPVNFRFAMCFVGLHIVSRIDPQTAGSLADEVMVDDSGRNQLAKRYDVIVNFVIGPFSLEGIIEVLKKCVDL